MSLAERIALGNERSGGERRDRRHSGSRQQHAGAGSAARLEFAFAEHAILLVSSDRGFRTDLRQTVDGRPQVRKAARFCLALTSFCSACLERCPVPGAMRSERGLPWVIADTCTGCGVCQEVCPAPRNAVLLLPGPVFCVRSQRLLPERTKGDPP